ncbi:MAG: pilus assembly protein N-terminal domain-containing protein [Selenomonadaceae bacterium]|nr:pilus assembly protein N-terminal domain-containing protein [Selenomonadaceae bacterium]MBQ7493010.1 pilus assembly protein N-terminal domain-containing protein [Selenomonadaceae bacterium]
MDNLFLKSACLAAVTFSLSAGVVEAAEFETLSIKRQTSHYMDMGKQITRIAVGNRDIASVVQLPGSASEFLIVTKTTSGSTALFVWTLDGVRHEYLIVVSPEDPGQAMMIERAIGLPDVHVKMVDDRILLTGTVENQYEKNYALQTARLFINGNTESSLLVGSGFDMKLETDTASSGAEGGRDSDIELSQSQANGRIIDLLQILHPTQIRLEAQIIEVNSEAAKELGLQYSAGGSTGIFSFGEDYTRDSRTSYSETSSTGWTNSFGNSGSYSGGDSSSYSDSYNSNSSGSETSDDGLSGSGYDSSSSRSSSRNGSNSSSRNNSYSGNSSFSRTVTSTWDGLRRFGNNPAKWIAQHFAPINVTLTALVNKGKAKILSRPSVMTLSGEQATIQVGGQIPYTSTNANGSTSTTFKNYGVILQFKPVVDAQHRINSAIHAEVSSIGEYVGNGLPSINTRSADSVINLSSGSPIVIGGLMNSSEVKNITKIPLLGDIPILGEFFKNTSKSRDNRELIIVVTPYLVGEDEISQAPMSQPMRDWYERQEKQREEMEPHDFKKPEEDILIETEPEPRRILPPANYPKNGKITDAPFK